MKGDSSTYPSKVDLWIAGLLIGAPIYSIGLGVNLLLSSEASGGIAILIGVMVGGMIALFAIPCRYTITDDSLRIRCGVLDEEIPLEKIVRAVPTMNPLSAPALSLKRVKIELDKGSRLISPVDRDGFIAELTRRIEARGRQVS